MAHNGSMLASLLCCILPRSTAFQHFNVVPMTGPRLLRDQTVVVRGDEIVAMGPSLHAHIPKGAVVIDGRRKLFLMPGLCDMHTHLRYENDLSLYLANGVTTVRNMRGTTQHLKWREEVRSGAIDGPRIYTAGPRLGHDPGYTVLNTAQEGDSEVRREKAAGYDCVKVYDELPGLVYKQVVKTAAEVGMPVVGHVNSDLGVRGVLAAHQYSIEHAEQYAYHWFPKYKDSEMPALVRAAPQMAADTKKARSWVCPTMGYIRDLAQLAIDPTPILNRPEVHLLHPETYLYWTTQTKPAESYRENIDLDHFQDALVHDLDRQGVGLLTGTDSYIFGSVMGFSLHRELCRMAEAGLSNYRVLCDATRNAGVFSHANFGQIKRGMAADLLILRSNPLRDLRALDQIEGVMDRGRWHSRSELDRMLAKIKAEYAPGLRFVRLVVGHRTNEALAEYAVWKSRGSAPIFDQGRTFSYLASVLKDEKRDQEAAQVAALN